MPQVTYRLECARAYPAGPAKSFDRVLAVPLPELFAHRHGPIPPVREVRDQEGEWGVAGPGQTRTIVCTDGTTLPEALVAVDRPHHFDYRIEGLTGPMAFLARRIDGRWAFEPAGTGVRVTWTWDVEPAGRLGRLAEGPFRRLWQGYAQRALQHLESVLVD